jgi:hypothetical protein
VTDHSNPLRGIVPKVVHKDDVDEAALVELVEKLPGQVVSARVKPFQDDLRLIKPSRPKPDPGQLIPRAHFRPETQLMKGKAKTDTRRQADCEYETTAMSYGSRVSNHYPVRSRAKCIRTVPLIGRLPLILELLTGRLPLTLHVHQRRY